jgi:hypothetical protein
MINQKERLKLIREHLPEEEANALLDRMIAMEKARRDAGQVLPPPLKKKELERGKTQSLLAQIRQRALMVAFVSLGGEKKLSP